jgi:hypothetical protein
MISRILGEAKCLMAEIEIEIRGTALKQRLLDHGLLTDPVSQRILFPEHVTYLATAFSTNHDIESQVSDAWRLYLTDSVFDRSNRESWEEAGSEELQQRANKQVEQRRANYRPIETDSHIDAAMAGGAEYSELTPALKLLMQVSEAFTGIGGECSRPNLGLL